MNSHQTETSKTAPIVDSLVEEVRERGRRFTQRFSNDPRTIFEYLRRVEQEHPEKIVSQVPGVAPPDEEPPRAP
jgi:hypothetical protein